MKKIEMIIRPEKIDGIRDALVEAGIRGMSVEEVRGPGRERDHTERFRDTEYRPDLLPKLKIEIVVADGMVEGAIAVLLKSANAGKPGDGKIFISTVHEAIRIRTEETDESAL